MRAQCLVTWVFSYHASPLSPFVAVFSLGAPLSFFPPSSGDRLLVQASRCIARRTTTPTTSLRFCSVANHREFPFKKRHRRCSETKDTLERPTCVRQRSGCPRVTHGKKRASNFDALEARFALFSLARPFCSFLLLILFFFLFFWHCHGMRDEMAVCKAHALLLLTCKKALERGRLCRRSFGTSWRGRGAICRKALVRARRRLWAMVLLLSSSRRLAWGSASLRDRRSKWSGDEEQSLGDISLDRKE